MSEEVAEFYLTGPKYLQQIGESFPRYVDASPGVPIKVVLPAKVLRKGGLVDQPESSFMRRVKPEKPKPAHAVVKQELVRKSHDAKASSESRAADK